MERFILLLILRLGLIAGAGLLIVGLIALNFTADVLRGHVFLMILMGFVTAILSGLALWLVTH